MPDIVLDHIDIALLSLLQKDASLSLLQLADKVNLSTTPCWKRLKRLEFDGILKARVALLDPMKLGLAFTAIVQVKTSNHSDTWYLEFISSVREYPEVMEFYRMAGEYDYMMKVQVADIQAFDTFYKKLVKQIDQLIEVTTSFAVETLKYTTALPI